MYNTIDLHTHSIASDGELSPTALVRHALACGLEMLALTDHDTIAGFAEAREAAQGTCLRIIAGSEISVNWHAHVIHILGLNIDPDNVNLQRGLSSQAEQREIRAHKIAELLEYHGLRNAYAGAKTFAGGHPPGRTHFARYLVQQGYAGDVRKVFKRYLAHGKTGYVAAQWASLEQVVSWITDAGGVAVVAHPARYKLTRTKLGQLLDAFKEVGGAGLEVVSGSHNPNDTLQMAALAQKFGLLGSVGSDYHGPRHFWLELGKLPQLPAGSRAVWEGFSLD